MKKLAEMVHAVQLLTLQNDYSFEWSAERWRISFVKDWGLSEE